MKPKLPLSYRTGLGLSFVIEDARGNEVCRVMMRRTVRSNWDGSGLGWARKVSSKPKTMKALAQWIVDKCNAPEVPF